MPPGSKLELTKVYDKGHAERRPVEGDFFGWVRPSDQSSRHQPAEPIADADADADAEAYRLGWIRPEDEGRLFERHA